MSVSLSCESNYKNEVFYQDNNFEYSQINSV